MPTLRKRIGSCILLALFFSTSIGCTFGQADYSIGLRGFIWPRRDIPVYLSGIAGPTYRDEVWLAMNIWVSAQSWFSDTYMQGQGYPFFLYLTDEPVEDAIVLSFTVGSSGNIDATARMEIRDNAPANVSIQVALPSSPVKKNDPYLQLNLLRAFGDTLGLGLTGTVGDVMSNSTTTRPTIIPLPSTLDLYALFLLGQNRLEAPIQLPQSIPYASPSWMKQGRLTVPSSYAETSLAVTYYIKQSASAGSTLTLSLSIKNNGKKSFRALNSTIVCDWNPANSVPSQNPPDIVQPGNQIDFSWRLSVPSNATLGNYTFIFKTWYAYLTVNGWNLKDSRLLERTSTIPVVKSSTNTKTATSTSPTSSSLNLGPTMLLFAILAVSAIAAILVLLRRRRHNKSAT